MVYRPEDNSDDSSFFPFGELSHSVGGAPIDEVPIFVDDTMADWGGRRVTEKEKNRRLGTSVKVGSLRLALGIMLLGVAGIVVRAAYVQVAMGAHYKSLAEGNRSRIEWIPAERGVMFDRNGTPLVGNAPRFTITVTPADLPRDDAGRRQVIGRVSEIMAVNPRDIEARLVGYGIDSTVAVPVAENITHEQAILADIMSARWPAVQLSSGVRRQYLLANAANSLSHVIGYEGTVNEDDLEQNESYLHTDRIGRTGLERYYESVLRGVYGRRRVEVDALGSRKTVIAEESGEAGKNLVLSIDAELQVKAQLTLEEALKRAKCSRGSVIVMKPDTGEVLAMVSLPSFDSNLFAKGISPEDYAALSQNADNPLFPRAIGASLASGSTFKPVIAAAALAEKIITPQTTFLSTGGIAVGQWFFPDWKAGGHGVTNVHKALSESVNTFFYIVGGGYEEREGLGVDRIIAYARKFGFGALTGIDLPGEREGFLPSKDWKESTKGERWYVGDTYHLSIGQGDILVTPLQIAVMTAAFANGGQLISPRLVNAIVSRNGSRQEMETKVLNEQVVPAEYIQDVRKGMRDSVLYGSSRSLSLLPVSAAGKTGTAQWSSKNATHAWFTAFAPYEQPEIVVTVIVEEGGEGSVTAAPIARDILQWYFEKE